MTNAELSTLDASACVARQREIEARFAATKDDPNAKDERKALRLETDALVRRLRELKEQAKAENARRNFAGFGSPLHEACVAMLDADTVAKLELDALARLAKRAAKSAAKKAAQAEQPAPEPPIPKEPSRPPPTMPASRPRASRSISRGPEVIVRPSRRSEISVEFSEAQRTPRK